MLPVGRCFGCAFFLLVCRKAGARVHVTHTTMMCRPATRALRRYNIRPQQRITIDTMSAHCRIVSAAASPKPTTSSSIRQLHASCSRGIGEATGGNALFNAAGVREKEVRRRLWRSPVQRRMGGNIEHVLLALVT